MTTFEDVLTDVQVELIGAALEYAGDGVSDVYVYGSREGGATVFDAFYAVGPNVVDRNDLQGVDTSTDRQLALLDYGMDQLDRLAKACKEFSQPIPTELKLHYSTTNKSLDSAFAYEPRYSHLPMVDPNDLLDAWRREVQTHFRDEAGNGRSEA